MSYAQTCVRMATKVIEVSIEHQRRGLLCPASWPSVYTVFVSVVCLIFAYATGRQTETAQTAKQDIKNGIRLLACTACTTDTGSVRCLEILRRLIKRVSYAVDIDLDQLCANTKPYCTTEFTGKGQRTTILNLEGPWSSTHMSTDPVSSPSKSSWMPPISDGGQQFSFSPNETMTRSSLSYLGYSSKPASQTHSDVQQKDEMIEVPCIGHFAWSDEQDYTGMSHSTFASGSRNRLGTSSQPGGRLKPEDIAGFMQDNPVDGPSRRRNAS